MAPMIKSRTEVLKLVILSAWISSAGGAAFSAGEGAVACEDARTIGCIPSHLVPTFGVPAPRSLLNSRFRVKARKKSKSVQKRRGSHHVREKGPNLSNQQDVISSTTTDQYDVSKNSVRHFDPEKKTVLIIHGWQIANEKTEEQFQNETKQTVKMGDWVGHLQDKILENDDANVIIYDWRGGALLGYVESRRNTWTAGQEVFLFLKSLMDTRKVEAKMIHLIGHSLGCHVAGIAGKRMFTETGTKIGRISALDPAAPGYVDSPTEVRLQKDDALFVDVYHTDGASLLIPCGIYQPVGHIDFYPNNGTDQPYCHKGNGGTTLFNKELCDHMLAYDYFTKSITEDTRAIQCSSYGSFLDGKCANCKRHGCYRIGYFLDQSEKAQMDFEDGMLKQSKQGKYYLQTSKEKDFCAKSLMFEVHWSRGLRRQIKKKHKYGQNAKLVITFEGNNGRKQIEQDDLDAILHTDGGDNQISRTKAEKYSRVISFPCSVHPFPIKSIKVELVQGCDKEVTMRSFWGNILSGGCDDVQVHIRRIKVVELNPNQYSDNFIPKRKLAGGHVMLLGPKSRPRTT